MSARDEAFDSILHLFIDALRENGYHLCEENEGVHDGEVWRLEYDTGLERTHPYFAGRYLLREKQ